MEVWIYQLQLDIGALKLRNAQVLRENCELERKNAVLASRLVSPGLHRPAAGNKLHPGRQLLDAACEHQCSGIYSAATQAPTVTALPEETLHNICSVLPVKALGRLATVSRRFSELCQEGARVAAMERHAPDRIRVFALEEGLDWLRILWRLEHFPTFVSCGSQVHVLEHGAVANWPELTQGTVSNPAVSGWQAAVCGGPMTRGRHYAEFTVESAGHGMVLLGVVGSRFSADDTDATDGVDDSRQFFDNGRNEAWVLSISSGALHHGAQAFDWPGQERWNNVKAGEVVGFELDVDRGTLAVWRRGSMLLPLGIVGQHLEERRVPLGLVTWRGRLAPGIQDLKPPLRWAANVGYCSRLRIRGGLPLPTSLEAATKLIDQAREWDNEPTL